MSTFTIKISIPERVEKVFVWPLMLYRKLKYGYSFRRIPLTRGEHAIVDPEDYEWLIQYKWHTNRRGEKIYAVNSRMEKMHRMIMSKELRIENLECRIKSKEVSSQNSEGRRRSEIFVDHINGDGRDNRRANLRLATAMQNAWNVRRTRGKSRYRGVKWHKYMKKWTAVISVCGKRRHLGYFDDEDAAARAYDEVVKQERGEFGVLNFPD
ncbi:MAG: HNH endonuclease [Phycisphaerae bacterium]